MTGFFTAWSGRPTAEPADIKAAAAAFVRWRRDPQRRPSPRRKRPVDASGYIDQYWDEMDH